jgi:hypothetical protein
MGISIKVAIDIKTKEILVLELTNEKVQDSRKTLEKLVDRVLKNICDGKNKVKLVLADGAHDTNRRNFRYLEQKGIGIAPGIKVRKNFINSSRNNRLRNKESRLKTKDLLK